MTNKQTRNTLYDSTLIRWIWTYAEAYRWWFISAFFTLVTAEVLPLLYPHILQQVSDQLFNKDFQLSYWLLFYALVVIFHSLFLFAKSWIGQHAGLLVIHDLRKNLYQRLQQYSLSFFHKTPLGNIMTRLGNDVDSLHQLFSQGLIDILSSLLMLLLTAAAMFWKDWRLALITIFWVPILIFLTTWFRRRLRKANIKMRESLAHLNARLQESFSGIPIIQLFHKEEKVFTDISHSGAEYRDHTLEITRLHSWFFPALHSGSDLMILSLYAGGIWFLSASSTTVGTLLAFIWYASNFSRPLRDISDKITQLQGALAAGERLYNLSHDYSTEDPGHSELQDPRKIAIEFSQVYFSYLPEKPVLKDISFSVKPNTMTAIVGPTGSGKTTLFSLLNRFYQPKQGHIHINGQDIRDIYANDLRNNIAWVTQDLHTFSCSLEENITFGRPFRPEKFREACAKARVDRFADQLPGGYQTKLGPGAHQLSNGQSQLVAFARALYADPSLLLLDEATSSIDSTTEAIIQEALENLIVGRTTIIIAHRLSTVAHADNIITLQNGKIAEQGSHEELIAQKGLYSELVEMQKF
jgi:ATP-binding cassette subfamily B protein